MTAIEYFWRRYWTWVVIVAFVALAVMGAQPSDKDLQETNKQLRRIADSLEIISGQRGTWKAPK